MARQKYPIGTTLSKLFDAPNGQRFFGGKITNFDQEEGYYQIVYEDGDKEELTEQELGLLSTKKPPVKKKALKKVVQAAKARVAKKTTKVKVTMKTSKTMKKAAPFEEKTDDESSDDECPPKLNITKPSEDSEDRPQSQGHSHQENNKSKSTMKTDTPIKKVTQYKEKTPNESSDDGCLKSSGKEDGVATARVLIPSVDVADGTKQNRKICTVTGCGSIAKRAGVCVRHGATQKRCSVEGCETAARRFGLCDKHGGKILCSVEGCTFSALTAREGVCRKHGVNINACIYKLCRFDAQKDGECWRHAGNRNKSLLQDLRYKYESGSSPIESQKIGAGWESALDPESGREYYFHPINDEWSLTNPILLTEGKESGEIPNRSFWESSKDPSSGIVYYFQGWLFPSYLRRPKDTNQGNSAQQNEEQQQQQTELPTQTANLHANVHREVPQQQLHPQTIHQQEQQGQTHPQSRSKQYLLLLRHASECNVLTGICTVTPHCAKLKILWRHIASCKEPQCKKHCMNSRYVLRHYCICTDSYCDICGPVKENGTATLSALRDAVLSAIRNNGKMDPSLLQRAMDHGLTKQAISQIQQQVHPQTIDQQKSRLNNTPSMQMQQSSQQIQGQNRVPQVQQHQHQQNDVSQLSQRQHVYVHPSDVSDYAQGVPQVQPHQYQQNAKNHLPQKQPSTVCPKAKSALRDVVQSAIRSNGQIDPMLLNSAIALGLSKQKILNTVQNAMVSMELVLDNAVG